MKTSNSITFLGTGTSVGIPMIGCPCEVCQSRDQRDKRFRTSALIQINSKNILIDIGPDFRTQAIQNNINTIDAILLTHPHRDHVGGFDDIRAINFLSDKPIDLYANAFTWESLKKQFYYAFMESDYTSVPKVNFHEINQPHFYYEQTEITTIEAMHGTMPCLGYRIGNMAYITDASYLSPSSLEKLEDLDLLILNSLRRQKHHSHFSLEESLNIISTLHPRQAYLTHLSHHMGKHEDVEKSLSDAINIAYDGLKIDF